MMKSAHLFQNSGISYHKPGAAQLHILHRLGALQQRGHEATLLALRPHRRVLFTADLDAIKRDSVQDRHYAGLGPSNQATFKLLESGVRRAQASWGLPYLAWFDSFRMYDACCQNVSGYDVLHERYNMLALGGVLAARKLRIPLVLEVHADVFEQRKLRGVPVTGLWGQYARWATRLSFNIATKIMCVSEELAEHLVHEWQIDKRKLFVLPCGADVEEFGRAYRSEDVRHRLGLNGDPIVMWVGGFYRWHNLDLLVDSFKEVLVQVPTAKLILVGDGETRSQVAGRVAEAGLGHAVRMTGAVAHEAVPELMSIADVAVSPAFPLPSSAGGTGTPLKLFEYMAAGKAVVATRTAQSAAVIEDRHNGLLVAPNGSGAFAQAVVTLLRDPEERKRLGENGRRYVVDQYSWARYAERLEEVYSALVTR